jgi:excisionase family DNA binding protein
LEQLLTAKEVGSILKVSPSAVFKWAKKGIIPSYRIHEKSLRFKISDIETFVEDGKGRELNYIGTRRKKWYYQAH